MVGWEKNPIDWRGLAWKQSEETNIGRNGGSIAAVRSTNNFLVGE